MDMYQKREERKNKPVEENESKTNINWFPGHMIKAKRNMQEHLKLVDFIIELRDARIPNASKNPLIDELIMNKSRLIILTKKDKAETTKVQAWIQFLQNEATRVIALDVLHDSITKIVVEQSMQLNALAIDRFKRKGIHNRPLRAMVVGIPNVGKSTFINQIARKRATKTANTPGVTRALQWVKVNPNLELLDTPGVLWPRFDDPQVAMLLAICGAIRDQVLPLEDICIWALNYLSIHAPIALIERYGITINDDPYDMLAQIGTNRKYLLNRGAIDQKRTMIMFLQEIRDEKLGKISWEQIHENNE